MSEADIPVDLFNPGQVFACLGFLEAADILLGDAEGGFDWDDDGDVRFRLRTNDDYSPFEVVLDFLAEADVKRFGPIGYADLPPKKGRDNKKEQDADEGSEPSSEGDVASPAIELSDTFPAEKGDRMALPIRVRGSNNLTIELGHWADGSGRESFKLYSGNRSADGIARAMLKGIRKEPSKKQQENGLLGEFKTKGLAQLWKEERERVSKEPLDILTPMGGSFNFDPHGAWTAIDAGYSPNDQKPKHTVEASPIVEFLAACGLEHARPRVFDKWHIRYAVWGTELSPMLARVALIGGIPSLPMRNFRFTLDSSGKNKIVTFAEEEI